MRVVELVGVGRGRRGHLSNNNRLSELLKPKPLHATDLPHAVEEGGRRNGTVIDDGVEVTLQ